MNSKVSFFIRHIHFVVCAFLFALLLARNPFGIRTQIPNFEPYPDSFHYVVPARSLLAGTGPYLTREGGHLSPSVPILYSLTLIPFFILHNDPRMFYIANVVFSFISLGLFYVILQKLKIRRSIQFLVLYMYVSNFYVYWYPTLAMAETLTMLLFFLNLLLLVVRVTPKRAALAALSAVALYYTKYANIPLTVAFGLLYSVKIFLPITAVRVRLKEILAFVTIGVVSFGLFSTWETYFYGRSLVSVITSLFLAKPAAVAESSAPSTTFFSLNHIPMNLRFYLPMIFGSQTKILWVFTPLLPKIVSIPAVAALVAHLADAKRRFFAFSLVVISIANVAFLSTFYAPDARYFLFLIPTLLFGIALLLSAVSDFCAKRHWGTFFLGSVGIVIILSLTTSALRLKNQISLNLRHAETPWYYISILELNQAVDDLHLREKPVVISALPPFLVDFYSQGKYSLLPLDTNQEFRNSKDVVFGDFDYTNLHSVYRKHLEAGKTVLVGKYGLGNEKYLQDSFEGLSKDFSLTLLRAGCHDLCNVYELYLKK